MEGISSSEQPTEAAAFSAPETSSPTTEQQEATQTEPISGGLLDEGRADSLGEQRTEREKSLVNAIDFAYQASKEDVLKRYGGGQDRSVAANFFARSKAFFAGEFADLDRAQTVAQKSLEAEKNGEKLDEAKEIQKQWRIISAESARRVGKVLTKTAVTGGIGAGITSILGGTVLAPAFLGALVGGAGARAAVELWRSINPKEREARTAIMRARVEGFKTAQHLQNELARFSALRDAAATDAERAEISGEIDGLYESLINISREHTYQVYYETAEGVSTTKSLAEMTADKMKLERRREKYADLAAAVGAVGGGILGGTIVQNQLLGQKAIESTTDQAASWMADYDKNGISHLVRHVNAQDIVHAAPGFNESLNQSGGYVFSYNASELTTELGQKVATATLQDGSIVHALGGIPPESIANLSKVATPEIAQSAITLATNLLKEVGPIAASNLLFSEGNFLSKSFSRKEQTEESESSENRFRPGQEVYYKGQKYEIGMVHTYGVGTNSRYSEKRQYELMHWIRGEKQRTILVDEEDLIIHQPKVDRVGFRQEWSADQVTKRQGTTPPEKSSESAPDEPEKTDGLPIIDAEFREEPAEVAPPEPPIATPPSRVEGSDVAEAAPPIEVPEPEAVVPASPEVQAVEALHLMLSNITPEQRQAIGVLSSGAEESGISYKEGDVQSRIIVKTLGKDRIVQITHIDKNGNVTRELGRGPKLREILQGLKDKLDNLQPKTDTAAPEVVIEPTSIEEPEAETVASPDDHEEKPDSVEAPQLTDDVQNLLRNHGIEDGADSLVGHSVQLASDNTDPIAQNTLTSLARQLGVEGELPDQLELTVASVMPSVTSGNKINNYSVVLRSGSDSEARTATLPLTQLLSLLSRV